MASEAAALVTTGAIIGMENEHIVQSYKRPPFVLVRGDGVTVYDADGKAYQDWVAGIAVNALGYGDAGLTAAIQQAATGLIHTSNLYYTAPQAELAALLCEKSFADRAFFTNSGAEANEGAIKFARKVAFDRGEHERTEIVGFSHAFHGRTLGALALTPKEAYQAPFRPLMPGARLAEFNDLDSAAAVISEKTAAVFVEPVQGEGGIYPASEEFLRGLRQLCDERGALLVFDEIQCGMGRTGDLWAHMASGVTPDIMTLAKPLAGGLPIGAILTTNAVAAHIHPGDHGTTFGGGAFITSVAKYVIERISDPAFLGHVAETGTYLKDRLLEINSPLIAEVRGRGLMVGLELTVDVAPAVQKGYEHGLLLVNAGQRVIRFVPPLVVDKYDVDQLIDRLTVILQEMGAEHA
ncbi:MAG TPA: aspartate aminotransferase family protein [Candidatus Limnocylindrales bacterium]|nr:aspartate aminotransferase family protein [Candidatus Limnocylindrales bacterium]